MNDTIKILDKTFKKSIPEETIISSIDKIAEKINADLRDDNPLFISILNGSLCSLPTL